MYLADLTVRLTGVQAAPFFSYTIFTVYLQSQDRHVFLTFIHT